LHYTTNAIYTLYRDTVFCKRPIAFNMIPEIEKPDMPTPHLNFFRRQKYNVYSSF